jgi:nitrite reductase/ring-hydroxylating ferredoxin subunit
VETLMRTLCRVTDIPDNGAKGFPGLEGTFTGFVAVRQGERVYVYENACPHIGTPLDWTPDRFLSADGRHLICATHGAEFTLDTGLCVSGPCRGDSLTAVEAVVQDGVVVVGG